MHSPFDLDLAIARMQDLQRQAAQERLARRTLPARAAAAGRAGGSR